MTKSPAHIQREIRIFFERISLSSFHRAISPKAAPAAKKRIKGKAMGANLRESKAEEIKKAVRITQKEKPIVNNTFFIKQDSLL